MDKFLEYINSSIAVLKKKEEELAGSDRKDEANFQKIKINIFDIARTFYNVVSRTSAKEKFAGDYVKKLKKLHDTWNISYEKAKSHDDTEKSVVEEIKLHTLEDIIAAFERRQQEEDVGK